MSFVKLEVSCLTKAQRCEIIPKLTKPNMTSKRKLGQECEANEGVIQNSSLSRHLLNLKVLPFKGFEALHKFVLNINDQLLCSDVQTKARQMYDEMR